MHRNQISRNTLINIAGAIAPLLLTLFTVPPYLRIVGEVRFGVLALVWLLLSYFAIFDMGLGRGTARTIAQLRDAGDEERSTVFWTALAINTGFGVIGGLILWAVARVAFASWLRVPPELHSELFSALPWLAAAVPVATNLSVLIGALEGREHFLILNSLQVFGSLVFQLLPLAVAFWHGPEMKWLIGAAVMGRALSSVPLLFACWRLVPLVGRPRFSRDTGRELFVFGGWITVSGLLTPIMATVDRLLMGVVSGAAAVTYYTVPCNFATKFSMLPASLSRTLFPRFSAQGRAEQQELGHRALLVLGAILTCVVAVVIPVVQPFFHWWIGSAMAVRSSHIGELLLVGIWANGWSWVCVAQLQARGRPNLVAKLHALELLPFLAGLWIGLTWGGVQGAAVAWTLRVILDTGLLLYASDLLQQVTLPLLSGLVIVVMPAVAVRFASESLLSRFAIALAALGLSVSWAALFARKSFPRTMYSALRLNSLASGAGIH